MKELLKDLISKFRNSLGNEFMGLELRDSELILSTGLLHDYIVQNYIGDEYKVVKMVYEWDEEDYECREWLIVKK
tara:strand:- start:812 stop:1036 length:225 start_codon:yes stop_codon:yes gene_type:complete